MMQTTEERKPQHTPGPWEYGTARNYEGFYIAPKNRMPTLAACQVFNYPAETEANARLMAAAPDLLAALEACLPFMGRIQIKPNGSDQDRKDAEQAIDAHAQARAAIAKAKGEA